jgi:6-phosphogluconolactonase (cycloisomerase 2 family)
MHGEPVPLPARAIHMTTDRESRHALIIYSSDPGLTVLKLDEDGKIGAEIPHAEDFRYGAGLHQVRVLPDDSRAILVSRGKKGFGTQKYSAGALQEVAFDEGRVRNLRDITPSEADAPIGFNPRDIDFHPSRSQIFSILEPQNQLVIFDRNGSQIDPTPSFTAPILKNTNEIHKRQDGGPIHIHPNGRFAYVGNRNDGYVNGQDGPSWLVPEPIPEFPGGENNIAVFALDTIDGKPRLIQHIDTMGLHPRTFSLDASGRILVAGNITPTMLREGGTLTLVPASLALFRIGDDGILVLLHKYDIDVGPEKIWWTGIVG